MKSIDKLGDQVIWDIGFRFEILINEWKGSVDL